MPPLHINQVYFDPESTPIHFRPPHKNKSIPIPRLKSSQFRLPTLAISTTHTTKSTSVPTLNPCHYRPVLLCVLYIRAHVPVIQLLQQYVSHKYEYQLVFLTDLYYSSKTPKILRKYIHHILYFTNKMSIEVDDMYMTTHDTGAGIRW